MSRPATKMVLVIAPKPNGNACYALYKGPLLASNLNRQPSGDFSPFSPLHSFLDISGSTVPDQCLPLTLIT